MDLGKCRGSLKVVRIPGTFTPRHFDFKVIEVTLRCEPPLTPYTVSSLYPLFPTPLLHVTCVVDYYLLLSRPLSPSFLDYSQKSGITFYQGVVLSAYCYTTGRKVTPFAVIHSFITRLLRTEGTDTTVPPQPNYYPCGL